MKESLGSASPLTVTRGHIDQGKNFSSYFDSPNFVLLLGRIFLQFIKQALVAMLEQNT